MDVHMQQQMMPGSMASMQPPFQTSMGGPPMGSMGNMMPPQTIGYSAGGPRPGGMMASMPSAGFPGGSMQNMQPPNFATPPGSMAYMGGGGMMPPAQSMQMPPASMGMPPPSIPMGEKFLPDSRVQRGQMEAGAPMSMQGQYMPNVSRPLMGGVANPPVAAGNIQYGPSYKMQYQRRSTADKTAVKYTGFLPLEGVYEEDTCRIG
mmetsp:Transcript_19130/g.52082  ORF Transcript_19130/g.52082 Transcript_19130/m.52082 type:complete len:205 (-) Transcript_19130:7-621(-)